MASTTGTDDREHGTGALFAFLCGALTGAALATLFAPASGRDTRDRLYAKARAFADSKQLSLDRFEEQLEEWSATIDRLAGRASHLTADARVEFERQIGELRSRREHARQTLGVLRTAGEDAWREIAAGADRAWQELRRGVDSASAKLS